MDFPNFKRLKNREDGSDFHDFWTELIASIRSIFSKLFASPNFFSRRRRRRPVVVVVVVDDAI